MTLEELTDKYLELQTELKDVKAEKETLSTTIKSLQEQATSKEEEVKKLQEHNMQLFLKVSQTKEEPTVEDNIKNKKEEDVKLQPQPWDDFMKDF